MAAKTMSLMVLSMRGSQSKPLSRPSVTASFRVITRATTVATTIVTLTVRARTVVRCNRTCEAPADCFTTSTRLARSRAARVSPRSPNRARMRRSSWATVAPTWSATSWTSSPAGLVVDTSRL